MKAELGMRPPARRGIGAYAPEGRRIKKRRGRRRDLVTGREDATIFSGLNIVLTKLYQMDIPSNTGYLTLISGFQFDIQWGLTYIKHDKNILT